MSSTPGAAATLLCVLTGVLLTIPAPAPADDWRVHLAICNQDPACAKEQAAARDLWDTQQWSPELKEACRKQYIQPYSKDYRAAVQCVAELETKRQEYELREAEINRKNKQNKTYRSWGGIIVK